jgi:predicted Na+-dependent transporter
MRLIEVIFLIALIHQTHTVSFLWQITRVIVYNTRQSVMPLLAFGTGTWLFPDNPFYVTGLVLAFIIPTGITSLIWVTIYRGNIVLTIDYSFR